MIDSDDAEFHDRSISCRRKSRQLCAKPALKDNCRLGLLQGIRFYAGYRPGLEVSFLLMTFRVSLIALLLLSACAQQSPKTALPTPTPVSDPEPAATAPTTPEIEASLLDKAQLSYPLLLAQIAADRGDYEVAASNFLFIARELNDVGLYRRAGASALLAKRFDLLERATDAWLQRQPNNFQALSWQLLAAGQRGKPVRPLFQHWLAHPDLTDDQLRPLTLELWRQLPQPALAELAGSDSTARGQLFAAYLSGFDGQLDATRQQLQKLLAQQPDYWPARQLLIELAIKTGDFETANAELDPLQPAADDWNRREQLAELWRQIDEFDRARQLLEQGLTSKPDWHSGRFLYALVLWSSEHPTDALVQLDKLIAASWQPERVYFIRAAVRLQQRQLLDAQQDAAKLNLPPLLQQWQLLHAQQLATSAPAQARAEFDRLYQRWPEQRWRWLAIETDLWVKQAQPDWLQQRLELLQQQDASAPAVRVGQIRLALLRQQPERASQQLQTWLGVLNASQQTELLANAWPLFATSRMPQAVLPMMDKLLLSRPDDQDLRYSRALAAAAFQDWDRALAEFDRLLQQAPQHSDYLNAKGYTLLEAGRDRTQAGQLIEQAARQAPTNAAVLDSLGWFYHLQGEHQQARQWLTRAWRLDKNIEIGQHLLVVLRALNDQAAAERLQLQLQHPDRTNLIKDNLQ